MSFRTAVHPDTNQNVRAYATDELDAELAQFEGEGCLHERVAVRTIPIAKGQQICEVCLVCGRKLSSPKPRTSFNQQPEIFDAQERHEKFLREREIARFAVVESFSSAQLKKDGDFAREYGQYLQSSEWRRKRDLVLRRASHVCEGCGVKPATEIHHLTYEHRFFEFLFELVALCPTCHSLIHFEKNPRLRSNKDENLTQCLGCRWHSEQDHQNWCAIFDIPSISALRSKNHCDSGRNGFEGLK